MVATTSWLVLTLSWLATHTNAQSNLERPCCPCANDSSNSEPQNHVYDQHQKALWQGNNLDPSGWFPGNEESDSSRTYVPVISPHTNPLWNLEDRDPLDLYQQGNNNSYSPPFPWAATRGINEWESAIAKARQYMADNEMTVEEKVILTTGVGWQNKGYQGRACVGNIPPIERIGFKGLCLQDGPAGVRFTDGVSVFPSGVSVAATFDREMMYQGALAMGKEYRGKGVHIALTPGALLLILFSS